VKVVLDTTILVRANEHAKGLRAHSSLILSKAHIGCYFSMKCCMIREHLTNLGSAILGDIALVHGLGP